MGLLSTGWSGFKGLTKAAYHAPAMTGATLGGMSGGLYTGLTDDSYNTSHRISNIGKGMFYGAVGGAAAMKAGMAIPRAMMNPKTTGKKLWGLGKGIGASAWTAGKGGYNSSKGAFRIGSFAMRHKKLIGGTALAGAVTAGAGAAYFGASVYNSSYGSPAMAGAQMKANYSQETIVQNMSSGVIPMRQMGPAHTMIGPFHKAMQQSTQGLVHGLHRGRH